MSYLVRGTPWAPMSDPYERGCCVIDLLRAKGVAAGWANNHVIAFPAITGVIMSPNATVRWLNLRIDVSRFDAMTPQAIVGECIDRIIEVQG